MRFGVAHDWRKTTWRYAPVALAGASVVALQLTTNALADIIRFRPFVIIEQIFADNVFASPVDRDADGITVLTARLQGLAQTRKINAIMQADVYHNEFWSINDLDSTNWSGTAGAQFKLWRENLALDTYAARRDVFLTPQAQASAGILNGQDQTQQSEWSVSPHFETEILDIADFAVRASYAQVQFDAPIVGPALVPLKDLTAKQLAANITTGERATLYEAYASAEHLETDAGFKQRNVLGSVILNVTQAFGAIGRMGYEKITDPSIAPIRGNIWSAGGRYRLRDYFLVQLEYGHRFGGVTWAGEVKADLGPRIKVNAQYTDSLEPATLSLTRSYRDLLNEKGNLEIPNPGLPNIPDPTVLDQIIRDKDLSGLMSYTYGLQTWEVNGRHIERQFPAISDEEKLYGIELALREQLSRHLSYRFSLEYFDVYEPRIGELPSETYRTELAVRYEMGDRLLFTGGYFWRLQSEAGNNDTYENVLRFGVQRAF